MWRFVCIALLATHIVAVDPLTRACHQCFNSTDTTSFCPLNGQCYGGY